MTHNKFISWKPVDKDALERRIDNINNSVFKTRQEADEVLAKKYGKRKDYNKMNEFKNIVVCIDGEYYKPCGGELKIRPREGIAYRLEVSTDPVYKIKEGPTNTFLIKDVIFNPPATIVFWVDGSKTVVKANGGDEFDPEKGLAMAIAKKALGNQGNYFNAFKDHIHKYNMSLFKDEMHEYVDEMVAEMVEHGASGKLGDSECQ